MLLCLLLWGMLLCLLLPLFGPSFCLRRTGRPLLLLPSLPLLPLALARLCLPSEFGCLHGLLLRLLLLGRFGLPLLLRLLLLPAQRWRS